MDIPSELRPAVCKVPGPGRGNYPGQVLGEDESAGRQAAEDASATEAQALEVEVGVGPRPVVLDDADEGQAKL